MKEFSQRKIDFTAIRLNDKCDKMFNIMAENFNQGSMKLDVTDLAESKSQSGEAVTKMFIEKATNVLSAKASCTKKPAKTPR